MSAVPTTASAADTAGGTGSVHAHAVVDAPNEPPVPTTMRYSTVAMVPNQK